MGRIVQRRDPRTGAQRSYYKADNGLLYADYNAAVAAQRTPSALVGQFLDRAKGLLQSAANRGVIPVPTAERASWGAATAVKGALGPLGGALRIMGNPDQQAYLQAQVDRAASSGDGSQLRYAAGGTGYSKPQGIREELANLALGQWEGRVSPDGTVRVNDDWNTNRNARWQMEQALRAAGDGNALRTGFHTAAAGARLLQDVGWINQRPLGRDLAVGQVAAPPRVAAAEPQSLAAAGSYTVKAGDTLAALSRQLGVSVEELAARNRIANPNMIAVGQRLSY